MSTFARLTTVNHEGRKVTARYEIVGETKFFVRARKVDAEGVTVEDHYETNDEGVETLVTYEHWIDKGAITKQVPLRMNVHYGTLEEEN